MARTTAEKIAEVDRLASAEGLSQEDLNAFSEYRNELEQILSAQPDDVAIVNQGSAGRTAGGFQGSGQEGMEQLFRRDRESKEAMTAINKFETTEAGSRATGILATADEQLQSLQNSWNKMLGYSAEQPAWRGTGGFRGGVQRISPDPVNLAIEGVQFVMPDTGSELLVNNLISAASGGLAYAPMKFANTARALAKKGIREGSRVPVHLKRAYAIAQREGLDLSLFERTGKAFWGSIETLAEKNLFSSGIIHESREKLLNGLSNFSERIGKKIGGARGRAVQGEIFKSAIEGNSDAAATKISEAYDIARKYTAEVGDLDTTVWLQRVEELQSELVKNSDKSLSRALSNLKDSLVQEKEMLAKKFNPKTNLFEDTIIKDISNKSTIDDLVKQKQAIHSLLLKNQIEFRFKKNQTTGSYEQVLKSFDDMLDDNVAKGNLPKTAHDALMSARAQSKAAHEIFGNDDVISVLKRDADTVVDILFTPNNSEFIETVKKASPKGAFEKLRGVWVKQLMTDPKSPNGSYSPTKFAREWRKFSSDPETLEKILDKDQIEMLEELAIVSERAGSAEKYFSSQGSSRANMAIGSAVALWNSGLAMVGALPSPVGTAAAIGGTAGIVLGPQALARVYTDKKMARKFYRMIHLDQNVAREREEYAAIYGSLIGFVSTKTAQESLTSDILFGDQEAKKKKFERKR